jgi:Leucine-rich repeat (LRR) protein
MYPLQSIGQLSQLIALNLDGNDIQVLPYEIFMLTALKVMTLLLLSALLFPSPTRPVSGALAARQRDRCHPAQRCRPHQSHDSHSVEQSGACHVQRRLLFAHCSCVLQLSTVPEGLRKLTKLNELWLKNNPLPRSVHARGTLFGFGFLTLLRLGSVPFRPADFPLLHVLLIDLTTAMPS